MNAPKESLSASVNGYKKKFFKAGSIILREGDYGEDMFIISSGRVEVCKTIQGQKVKLGLLSRGDFFGEMSLLEGLPRSADVFALDDTELLIISAGGLLLKIRRDPTFALEMLRSLSGRLRNTTEQFSERT